MTTGCHDEDGGAPVLTGSPRVALVGSPNAGKTSVFNQLTGLRARTGNYPGVTVARSTGSVHLDGRTVVLEDLPGAYSLHPISPDEKVVSDLLAGDLPGVERPDALLVVIDATVLERSLTLLAQALSVGLPTALVVTMIDEIAVRGGHVDLERLQQSLGIPVAGVVGSRGRGFGRLRELLTDPTSWPTAIVPPPTGDDSEAPGEADAWIRSILESADYTAPHGHVPTARVDRVLLHPLSGSLIFFIVMFLFFQVIFTVAAPLQELIEKGFGALGEVVTEHVSNATLADFLSTALIGGVGGIIVFLPQIVLLFFLISLLENIGYMSRAAFLMDRVMRSAGLEGRAFVAMLSSFACAVPGILATRTIPSSRSRIATILAAPLMTCSARLPVFILLSGMLVGSGTRVGVFNAQGIVMFGLYVLGGVSSMIAAAIFKRTMLRGDLLPFYMEMPPYRIPSAKAVLVSMWDASWIFLRKVGTIILATAIVIWVLLSLPTRTAETAGMEESEATQYVMEHSAAGKLGNAVEPVFAPLGFDWRLDIGLLASMSAREVFVSTMGQIAAAEDAEEPADALENMRYTHGDKEGEKVFTAPTVAALLIFFVYALQCMSTVGAIRRETNSWKWPAVAFGYMFVLAWVLAFVAHEITALVVG